MVREGCSAVAPLAVANLPISLCCACVCLCRHRAWAPLGAARRMVPRSPCCRSRTQQVRVRFVRWVGRPAHSAAGPSTSACMHAYVVGVVVGPVHRGCLGKKVASDAGKVAGRHPHRRHCLALPCDVSRLCCSQGRAAASPSQHEVHLPNEAKCMCLQVSRPAGTCCRWLCCISGLCRSHPSPRPRPRPRQAHPSYLHPSLPADPRSCCLGLGHGPSQHGSVACQRVPSLLSAVKEPAF